MDRAELDFPGLRADIEAATRLPEFDRLARRSRRTRRRDRTARLVVGLVILLALAPAALVGLNAAPAPGGDPQATDQTGPDQTGPDQPVRETSLAPPISTIRAVAGPRMNTLYAAVDVCRPMGTTTSCSLQVVPLGHTAQDQRAPIAVGELRRDDSDPLQDVTLQAMSPQSLLLSGVQDGQRRSRRIVVGGGGTEIAPEPSDDNGPSLGDLLVQLRRYGELFFVRQTDDRVFRTPTLPELDDMVVVSGVAPADGWWVTGTDPKSREAAVAVSKDLGRSWMVRPLAVRPGMGDAVLATADGESVFAFVRTSDGIQQRRSLDGGQSWQPVVAHMPWPELASGGNVAVRRLGAVVRTDGTLLVWIEEPPGAIFLESTDSGASYHPASGPAGPILALSDGYVAQGDPPLVSIDARTWTALARPATVPPG